MKKILKIALAIISFSTLTSCMVATSGSQLVAGKSKTLEKQISLNQNLNSVEKRKILVKDKLFEDGWKKTSETETSLMLTKKASGLKEIVSKNQEKQVVFLFQPEKTEVYFSIFGAGKNSEKTIDTEMNEIVKNLNL